MGKFTDSESAIFSVFALAEWAALGIVTMPSNFIGQAPDNKYIRVTVIASAQGINIRSVVGILNIDIFTFSGQGSKAVVEIADQLDLFLVGKTRAGIVGKVQFLNSNKSPLGADKQNNTLSKDIY